MKVHSSYLHGAILLAAVLAGCATPDSTPLQPPGPPPPAYSPALPPPPSPSPARPVAPAPSPAAAATAPAAAPSPAQQRLAEGVSLFDKGDFNGAIRKLTTAPELAGNAAEPDVRAEALKYSAFSYCVSNRRALCRRQFDTLLTIDPGYQLKAAEAGHPVWGPVFIQARRAAETAKRK